MSDSRHVVFLSHSEAASICNRLAKFGCYSAHDLRLVSRRSAMRRFIPSSPQEVYALAVPPRKVAPPCSWRVTRRAGVAWWYWPWRTPDLYVPLPPAFTALDIVTSPLEVTIFTSQLRRDPRLGGLVLVDLVPRPRGAAQVHPTRPIPRWIRYSWRPHLRRIS
ncbi:hypothetical protein BJV74DRAFT_868878 [Russula compacta]|nr:hypothetical protein BJV74DRAFT_868878 [Russula compacta]